MEALFLWGDTWPGKGRGTSSPSPWLLFQRFPLLLSRGLPRDGVATAGAVCRLQQCPNEKNVTRCWEQNTFYPIWSALLVKSDTGFVLKQSMWSSVCCTLTFQHCGHFGRRAGAGSTQPSPSPWARWQRGGWVLETVTGWESSPWLSLPSCEDGLKTRPSFRGSAKVDMVLFCCLSFSGEVRVPWAAPPASSPGALLPGGRVRAAPVGPQAAGKNGAGSVKAWLIVGEAQSNRNKLLRS